MLRFFLTSCVALLTIWVVGCAVAPEQTPVEKDGKVYGVTKGLFRGRWWNYYERGNSFADGGFWKRAEADYKRAIKGWDADRRRIKTYGWHVIEYFPHRELGVSLYHQQRHTEAIKEIETSLSMEKSAKAEFYLDKARKAIIEKERIDISPPEILIDMPENFHLTNNSEFTIQGVVIDDTFVKSIWINHKPMRIDLSHSRLPFQQTVDLRPGDNDILIRAVDITGKSSETLWEVFCDRVGPVLNIDETSLYKGPEGYKIRGYAHDRSVIQEIQVNGQTALRPGATEVLLDDQLLPVGDAKTLLITAIDLAGNRTSAEIALAGHALDNPSGNPENALLASLEWVADAAITHFTFPKSANANLLLSQASRGFLLPEAQKKSAQKALGVYHALIIGIDAYADYPQLKTAVNDASALKTVLIRRYGFLPENIVFRTDEQATWTTIIQELKQTTASLTENDNLLIYFAGHGEKEPIAKDGYWVPVDGKKNDPSTWITNSSIRNIVCAKSLRAKNVIIVADACYSASLFRHAPDHTGVGIAGVAGPHQEIENLAYGKSGNGTTPRTRSGGRMSVARLNQREILMRLSSKKSRQVVSSGGLEPVADTLRTKGRHSLFAHHLLKALRNNDDSLKCLTDLIREDVWAPVVAEGVQRPVIGRLMTPIDEDGQFVLSLKTEGVDAQRSSKEKTTRRRPDPGLELLARMDNDPPDVQLEGWRGKRTVFIDQALLEMTAQDESGVQTIFVDGVKILKRPGRNKLRLNYMVDLKEGENNIRIECLDQVGNQAVKTVRIVRAIPKTRQLGVRMAVSMQPFILEELATPGVEDLLLGSLKDSRRFNLLKHPKRRENGHSPSLENGETAPQSQRAAFILTGRIRKKETSLDIRAQITEMETEQVVTAPDVYGEHLDAQGVRALCHGLAVKLCDALPLVEGKIAKINGQEVIINLGERDQIKSGMHLVFFEEGEPVIDPDTGENLGADTVQIGTGRVRDLLRKMSYAEVLESNAILKLKRGMRLVMK